MSKSLSFPIASEPNTCLSQKGKKLFAKEIVFLKGVVSTDGLPIEHKIEVCFCGRSNVGKSSLLNAITNRKSLARSSNTPGRTQEINFFSLNDTHFLVDLPGYGYASAPIEKVKKWQELLKAYLAGRVSLRRVFLLVDSRHGIMRADEEMMSLLDKVAVTFQVVLTKADKPKSEELAKSIIRTQESLRSHPTAFPEIILSSATKNIGINCLRATIANF